MPQFRNGPLARVRGQGVKAGTAQAWSDGVLLAHQGFVDKFRVSELLPPHSHKVALPGGDGLLDLLRRVEATHGNHGDVDVLFNSLRQIQIAAVLVEHGGKCLGVDVILIHAGGDVNQVNMILNDAGELNAVLQGHAALDALRTAHAVLDEKILSADLLDFIADHDGEPGAVLHAAAEFVGTVIEAGGNELIQQPAVAAVEVHHLEAQGFTYPGRFRPLGGGFLHHLHRHFLHLHPVFPDESGGADGIFVAGNGVRVVHGPYMVELDGGNGSVGLDRLRQGHDALHVERRHGIFPDVQAMLVPPGVFVVDEALCDGHNGKSAPGFRFVNVDALRGGVTVVYNAVGGDGGGNDPVLKGQPADGHGGKHMGIFVAGHM